MSRVNRRHQQHLKDCKVIKVVGDAQSFVSIFGLSQPNVARKAYPFQNDLSKELLVAVDRNLETMQSV